MYKNLTTDNKVIEGFLSVGQNEKILPHSFNPCLYIDCTGLTRIALQHTSLIISTMHTAANSKHLHSC